MPFATRVHIENIINKYFKASVRFKIGTLSSFEYWSGKLDTSTPTSTVNYKPLHHKRPVYRFNFGFEGVMEISIHKSTMQVQENEALYSMWLNMKDLCRHLIKMNDFSHQTWWSFELAVVTVYFVLSCYNRFRSVALEFLGSFSR